MRPIPCAIVFACVVFFGTVGIAAATTGTVIQLEGLDNLIPVRLTYLLNNIWLLFLIAGLILYGCGSRKWAGRLVVATVLALVLKSFLL